MLLFATIWSQRIHNPITAMEFSIILRGKHCQWPIPVMGVVDTLGHCVCCILYFFMYGVLNQDWDLPLLPLCTNVYLDTWHHFDHCAGSYSSPILSYSPTRIEHACWVSTEVAFQTFAHLSLTIAFVTFMWEQETGNQSLSFLNIRFLKFLSCTMDLALNFLILIHLLA